MSMSMSVTSWTELEEAESRIESRVSGRTFSMSVTSWRRLRKVESRILDFQAVVMANDAERVSGEYGPNHCRLWSGKSLEEVIGKVEEAYPLLEADKVETADPNLAL